MTRPPRPIPPCLACRHTPGHSVLCLSGDDKATYYLQHPLPGGHRDWTPAGIRYTGTPTRRAAIRALMPTTRWKRMYGNPKLPMSPGLLIKQILAEFGSTARRTARIGYTSDNLTTLDCRCDPWRCTHDHAIDTTSDWLTNPGPDPDLLVNVPLVAVEIRWPELWQTYWFADAGGAVNPGHRLGARDQPARDQRGLPSPVVRPVPRQYQSPAPATRARRPCPCSCHMGTPS